MPRGAPRAIRRVSSWTRCAPDCARRVQLLTRRCQTRLRVFKGHLGVIKLLASVATALRIGEHRPDRAAMLATQLVDYLKALLDQVDLARLGLQRFRVRPQVAGELAGLRDELAPAGNQRVESAIDALHPIQLRADRRDDRDRSALLISERLDASQRSCAQRLDMPQPFPARHEIETLVF